MKRKPKRKVGRPLGSGKGRTVTTSSISLPPELWQKLDRVKGTASRSSWVAKKIKNQTEK